MTWTVAGLTGHVCETSIGNGIGIWQREAVFDAGFETLLAQSKQESLPNPKRAVTTIIALQGLANHLRAVYGDLNSKIPGHEMWKTEESFAASRRWSAVGSESGKMRQPHG